MQYIAFGIEELPRFLRLPYRALIVAGLAIALMTALAPLAFGYPALKSFHATLTVPIINVKIETALAQLFDLGILLLVVGGVMTAALALAGGETKSPAAGDDAEETAPAVDDAGEVEEAKDPIVANAKGAEQIAPDVAEENVGKEGEA